MNKYDIIFLKNTIFNTFFPKFLRYLSLRKLHSFIIKLNIPHAGNDLLILFLPCLIYDLYSFSLVHALLCVMTVISVLGSSSLQTIKLSPFLPKAWSKQANKQTQPTVSSFCDV